MAEKRIIEQTPSDEIYSDDWFLKDSPTQETSKILGSDLKDAILDGLDTEVEDIRVGADGTSYASAGDAVRDQLTNLEEYTKKSIYVKGTNFIKNIGLISGYLNQSGEVVSSSNYLHTLPIYIKGVTSITYSGFTTLGTDPGAIWLDANKTFIRYFKPTTNSTVEISVPNDAYYLAISIHKNDVGNVTIIGNTPIVDSINNVKKIAQDNNNLAIKGDYTLTTDLLEVGGISFSSSGWTYSTNVYRVRTKEGLFISVKKGDIISVDSGYSFIVGIKKSDDSYIYSGVNTSDYTINYEGELSLVFYKSTEEVVNNVNDYIGHITISRPNNAVTITNNLYIKNYIDLPSDLFTVGTVYYYYGRVVETSTSGYLKTGLLGVASGSTIILKKVASVAYQYAILFDKNENVIGTIKALDTATAHNDVILNIPQNCKYIRFNIKSGQVPDRGAEYTSNLYYTGITQRKAIITFIDDDTSSVDCVQRYYNALSAASVKGTYAVQTIELTNQTGLADLLRTYEKAGFGMVYHCHQQIPAYSTEQRDIVAAESDFVLGLTEMQDNKFVNYKYWVTPYGVYEQSIQDIARRHGMKCLISAANWAYNDPKNTNKYFIRRSDLHQTDEGHTHTIAELKALIDDAYNNNAWIIVTTHFNEWNDEEAGDSRLTEIVNYALNKGLEVKTLPEAYSYYETAFNIYELLR